MQTIEITKSGKIIERDLLRKDVADEYGMFVRDLRPVFSAKQLSTISRRGSGIIINLWEIKMVIGQKSFLLFQPESKSIQEDLIPLLQEKIQKMPPRSRFSLGILESCLAYTFRLFNDDFEKNEKAVHRVFNKLKKDASDEQFETLLNIKKRINKLQITIKEIEEMLEEIMKSEEDMLDLYLIKKGKNDIEEIESILEHYWEQYEDLSHRVDELNENIDDTQEFITLKMANRRNIIIKFDLFATLITAVLSGMAVVVGAFGMNLKNNMENSNEAFVLVVFASFLFFFFALIGTHWYLKRKKVW
jgi:Mg2+ and Co2+ transporter CorA